MHATLAPARGNVGRVARAEGRALASGPSTRVILVSSLSRAQLPLLPEDAVFLPKPYRISQLMELLQ